MISRKWHWALSPRPGLGNYSRRLQSVEETGRHIDAMQSGESWTEEAKDWKAQSPGIKEATLQLNDKQVSRQSFWERRSREEQRGRHGDMRRKSSLGSRGQSCRGWSIEGKDNIVAISGAVRSCFSR